ncbi:MAG: NAD/NADP octopine/nopaline dehydrogenase family protein [Cloacibacillus porcorum]|uniref:NAD/NADP-dependent octopine/nopaline dehydrogenase family protein n=1 Tax=Cloacibacillus porcorum TaxID=1197717 RepID=UPI002351F963|nr:NAD/NADP-dependent octopine/nopaline dehydrogenase family protein [Cloacibacillus porcorum]MCI5865414.1 NAD/NADP octopine/nopaline dehydrogenase family protein [Cloacibacillus porcorum]
MSKMEYLKDMPIAVLGGGAVGKTCAADAKLAGREVRLYDMMPFAETTLANIDKTGILLDGVQRNLYCFERSGRAFFDIVTSDIEKAVKGAGLIVVAAPAMAHEPFFRALIPYLEDGQVVHIFTDNFATLLLRKLMREMGCTKKVIIGGWSSAPYGTRIENVNGFAFPHVGVKYRAITLRGASLPMSDIDDFLESSKYLPCIDAVTQGNGPEAGNTVLDIGFANINPVIHVPATILGVSTMENWGKIFGGYDKNSYSMYCHGLCPSICEVQYQFYEEEKAIAKAIGVGTPSYSYESFFSRRSVLTQEYMGLNKDGNDNVVFPLDQPSTEGNLGPNNINHRYLTEDVPVGCKIYHDLGVQYGVATPVIDSMIILAGAMHKKSFFETSKYSLAYLGIDNMSKEDLLEYLNNGNYRK